MSNALLLNASFEPLHVVSWQRALHLLFQGKVEVIEESDQVVRTVSFSFRLPSVLRLLSYLALPRRRRIIRFSRENVLLRDRFCCQYCNRTYPRHLLTLDHVIPVVQGGKRSWDNIVTSCKVCNQRKGGRTPAQAGMRLTTLPTEPKFLPRSLAQSQHGPSEERWKEYLLYERDRFRDRT